jgi:hypothetical protein
VKGGNNMKQNLVQKAEIRKTVLLYRPTGLLLGKYTGDYEVLYGTVSRNKVQKRVRMRFVFDIVIKTEMDKRRLTGSE